MKSVYKKAFSLANKKGQKFIELVNPYYTFIGIEEGNKNSWFILIAQSNDTGKYICFSISRYDSGGAAPSVYGDMEHFIIQKAENMCCRYFFGLRFWLRSNLIGAYKRQISAKYNIKF